MDKLPEDWLFVSLTRIEDAQTRHASEMRLSLQSIRDAQSAHIVDDTKVEARVAALERRQSDTSALRRHTQTALITTGLLGLYEGAKALLGR